MGGDAVRHQQSGWVLLAALMDGRGAEEFGVWARRRLDRCVCRPYSGCRFRNNFLTEFKTLAA